MSAAPLPWNVSKAPAGWSGDDGPGDVSGFLDVVGRGTVWCELDGTYPELRWFDRTTTRTLELPPWWASARKTATEAADVAGTFSVAKRSAKGKGPPASKPPRGSSASFTLEVLPVSDLATVRRRVDECARKDRHRSAQIAAGAGGGAGGASGCDLCGLVIGRPVPLGQVRLGARAHLLCRTDEDDEDEAEDAARRGGGGGGGEGRGPPSKPRNPWLLRVCVGQRTVAFAAPSEAAFRYATLRAGHALI